ncbi:MAG TPA: DUF2059 domain-containing protein [Gemmatimonadales bacterium]|nr:DUF2059 domain-containing protein [Gemmatimonadales bacterium]
MTGQTRVLLALLCVTVALTPSLVAQQSTSPDAAKTATIRRFLELTGAAQLSVRAMEAMVPAQRAANPQIPAAFWDAFMARAKRNVNQLVDSLVPIYAAHFTQPQLEQLLRFYESPDGRHLIEVQPLITQASIEVGQRWGATIGRQVAESLTAGGGKPPN